VELFHRSLQRQIPNAEFPSEQGPTHICSTSLLKYVYLYKFSKGMKSVPETSELKLHFFWSQWSWLPVMNLPSSIFPPTIGRGWASVLKTNCVNGKTLVSPNNKYRYFRVSPRKKVSILSLFGAGMTVTSLRDVYPPELTFVCLSNAWKMFQPQFLYLHYRTRKISCIMHSLHSSMHTICFIDSFPISHLWNCRDISKATIWRQWVE